MLTSLDGPMGILLVPIAAVLWLNKPENRTKKIPIVLLCCSALVQTVTILWSHSRTVHSNGTTLVRLISILGRQIFLGSLLGMNLVYQLIRMHSAYAIEVAAVLLGLAILLYGFWHARLEIRLLLTFATVVFEASLLRPLANPTGPQREFLRIPGCGTRYYFFPMIAFLTAVVWCARNAATPKAIRYVAIFGLLLLRVGLYRDWHYPAFVDFHFKDPAARFEEAPAGTKVTIPINPPGWAMRLTKR